MQQPQRNFPVELPAWFIRLFTKPEDVVLDPFIGSGTTAVACAQLDRHFISIEIDPEYIQIAKKRLEAVAMQPRNLLMALEAEELYGLKCAGSPRAQEPG